jgi:N-acetylglucosamine-6-phosphate deacetylase
MPRQMIRVGLAITPHEEITDAAIVISDRVIESVGPRAAVATGPGTQEIDARQHTAVPGFVDIHVHGAGAHDVMEGTPDALNAITTKLAAHGTTALLATTVTAPVDATCRSIANIAEYIKTRQEAVSAAPQAQVLGIHFEGPFISAARRGVHPPGSIILPSVGMLDRFVHAADGCARILTLAPELPGAAEVIAAARAHDIIVAMGHTDATYDQACAGISAGVRHAVHVFNAMRPFSHRETGVLGAVLTDERVTAEIIADGIHVDVPAIRVLLAAKGMHNVILISDGTAGTGMPDGTYQLGPLEFTVSGGVCRDSEGRLAGSTLTLDRAIRQVVSFGVPLRDAVAMATINPARRLNLQHQKGVLAPGADADVVFLREDLTIAGVMTRGAMTTASASQFQGRS